MKDTLKDGIRTRKQRKHKVTQIMMRMLTVGMKNKEKKSFSQMNDVEYMKNKERKTFSQMIIFGTTDDQHFHIMDQSKAKKKKEKKP